MFCQPKRGLKRHMGNVGGRETRNHFFFSLGGNAFFSKIRKGVFYVLSAKKRAQKKNLSYQPYTIVLSYPWLRDTNF